MLVASSLPVVISSLVAPKSPRKPKMGRRHKACSICGKRHDPWWNSSKGRWFLSVPKDGGGFKQLNLGPDHDEALATWHGMESGLLAPAPAPELETDYENMRLGDLFNTFLVAWKDSG